MRERVRSVCMWHQQFILISHLSRGRFSRHFTFVCLCVFFVCALFLESDPKCHFHQAIDFSDSEFLVKRFAKSKMRWTGKEVRAHTFQSTRRLSKSMVEVWGVRVPVACKNISTPWYDPKVYSLFAASRELCSCSEIRNLWSNWKSLLFTCNGKSTWNYPDGEMMENRKVPWDHHQIRWTKNNEAKVNCWKFFIFVLFSSCLISHLMVEWIRFVYRCIERARAHTQPLCIGGERFRCWQKPWHAIWAYPKWRCCNK